MPNCVKCQISFHFDDRNICKLVPLLRWSRTLLLTSSLQGKNRPLVEGEMGKPRKASWASSKSKVFSTGMAGSHLLLYSDGLNTCAAATINSLPKWICLYPNFAFASSNPTNALIRHLATCAATKSCSWTQVVGARSLPCGKVNLKGRDRPFGRCVMGTCSQSKGSSVFLDEGHVKRSWIWLYSKDTNYPSLGEKAFKNLGW